MSDQDQQEKQRRTTVAVLVGFVILGVLSTVALLVYDLIAYSRGGNEATLSKVILDTSRDWPIIPLLVGLIFGLLSGHFFWPQQGGRP